MRTSERSRTQRAVGARAGVALVLALALLMLAGCGGDDGSTVSDPGGEPTTEATPTAAATDSATPSASASEKPAGPPCEEVWVDGGTLPRAHQDCYEDDKRVKADGRYCEFGKTLVTYDNRFWAVPGGPVFEVPGELLDDDGYRTALAKCSG